MNEEQAAILIQSLWRGHLQRRPFKEIRIGRPCDLRVAISGNEPEVKTQNLSPMAGYYVFVGTSALANFHWIKKLSSTYQHPPKLYLIDYSRHVKPYWDNLKSLMAKSENYRQFKRLVLRDEKMMNPHTQFNDYVAKTIINFDQLIDSRDAFGFFKEVLCKATIISGDWRDPRVFRLIRRLTDESVPIVAYASNILEFMGNQYDKFKRDVELQEEESSVQRLATTIQILNPTLVIHSRTSRVKSNSIAGRIHPDRFVFVHEPKDVKSHLVSLERGDLIPLERGLLKGRVQLKKLPTRASLTVLFELTSYDSRLYDTWTRVRLRCDNCTKTPRRVQGSALFEARVRVDPLDKGVLSPFAIVFTTKCPPPFEGGSCVLTAGVFAGYIHPRDSQSLRDVQLLTPRPQPGYS